MKERIGDVAAIIYDGDSSDKIKNIWWYSNSFSPTIFINHNNTIIEAGIIDYSFDELKELLTDTTIEISKRVERLSE
jgi:hypothetical protein